MEGEGGLPKRHSSVQRIDPEADRLITTTIQEDPLQSFFLYQKHPKAKEKGKEKEKGKPVRNRVHRVHLNSKEVVHPLTLHISVCIVLNPRQISLLKPNGKAGTEEDKE